MIINETMAQRVFGDADPIGRRMRSWRDENVLREIVGVVKDVRYMGLGDEPRSLVYVPHQQDEWGAMTVAVRASRDPALLAGALRREVAKLDPDIAVARIRTLSALAAESIAPQQFGAILILLFAVAAALLAGAGVYGVMSFAVAQRRQEFGVRLALGATPGALFALVMRRGLALAIAGGVLGLAGAIVMAPVVASLLFAVEPRDPATFLIVTLVLLGVALAASALPGRRAARVDPLEAVRD
jgi:putative ABC transport system permease protein